MLAQVVLSFVRQYNNKLTIKAFTWAAPPQLRAGASAHDLPDTAPSAQEAIPCRGGIPNLQTRAIYIIIAFYNKV